MSVPRARRRGPAPPPSPLPRGALPPVTTWEGVAVAALCCMFLALALPLVWWNSGAYDEGPHIASGFAYLTTGVFSGGIGNPPLAQVIVALPVLARAHGYPLFDETALPWARLSVVVATLATALLIWRGGRRHGGRLAGLAGMALWVFEPTVLAHGTLATVDMLATTGVVFTTYALWRVGSKPAPRALLLAGVVLGATLLTKYAVWMLLPVWGLCVVWPWGRAAGPAPRARMRHVAYRLGAYAIVCAIAYVVLGSGFLWRGMGSLAPAGSGTALAFAASVLPEACVRGLATVSAHARGGHMAYLLGQHSPDGFASYFLVAMAVKWTLPFLALLVMGAAVFASKRRVPAPAECALLFPPIAWVVIASTVSRVDIGIRHLLPIMPLLCEAAGVTVATLAPRGRGWQVAVAAAVALHAASSLSSWPHAIGYFNIAAGGAAGGDRVLIDSNIDWGTDRRWVEAAKRADATLRIAPRDLETPGPLALNVNQRRGLFGTPREPQGRGEPRHLITPAWRVWDRGAPPPHPAAVASPATRARDALHDGRLEAAAHDFTQLTIHPADRRELALALLGLVQIALRSANFERADSLLASARADSADFAAVRVPRGTLRAEIAAVRTALAGDDIAAQVAAARWLAAHGAFDAAFRAAEAAWRHDPADDTALAFLGNLAIDEKAGQIAVDALPADHGFWLSALRRRLPR